VRHPPHQHQRSVYPVIRNPIRAAYLASLESQISSLRDELATVYKTQGQNAQRLLAMNETLREKEEFARIDSENLRKTKDEIALLKRKVDQHAELMQEKDRTVQVLLAINYILGSSLIYWQILHDEISTLQLELGQIEERNQGLQKDNAKLLQRWLDAKQADANKMNEANAFYEDMRSRHQAISRNGADGSDTSPSSSGKGEIKANHQETGTPEGTLSPTLKMMNLTPNG
jgi:autophagy-related protein 16